MSYGGGRGRDRKSLSTKGLTPSGENKATEKFS